MKCEYITPRFGYKKKKCNKYISRVLLPINLRDLAIILSLLKKESCFLKVAERMIIPEMPSDSSRHFLTNTLTSCKLINILTAKYIIIAIGNNGE